MAEKSGHRALAIKARRIYNERLKGNLEACCRGQFVAIEADSGDYFLGPTPLEAIKGGKSKYPKKSFHVMKVGYKAAVLLKRWRGLPSRYQFQRRMGNDRTVALNIRLRPVSRMSGFFYILANGKYLVR